MEELVIGVVNVGSLRIRQDVNTESEIIGYAAQDEELIVEAISDEWLSITNSAGIAGFVMAKYVTIR